MRRVVIPFGAYTDVAGVAADVAGVAGVAGDYASVILGSHIETSRGRVELPGPDDGGEDLLFLRTGLKQGRLLICGKGHDSDYAWKYDPLVGWTPHGPSHGNGGCIFDADGELQIAGIAQGSQGYRYVAEDGRLVTGDETVNSATALAHSYGLSNLWEWNKVGDVFIGQGLQDACVADGPLGRRVLEPLRQQQDGRYVIDRTVSPACTFIHTVRRGQSVAVAIVKLVERKAIILWFDADELAFLPLESDLAPALPSINRDLYIGCFNFAEGESIGNCALAVRRIAGEQLRPTIVTSETAPFVTGQILGEFMSGDRVETIEALAQEGRHRPVAYWDARDWPRLPVLPPGAWLCLQGYCKVGESLLSFEASLSDSLARFRREIPTQPIAIVCQAYTSNVSQTQAINALVPVFGQLAIRFPQVVALLVFSGAGRATGLDDHPETETLWRQLAATTSTPPFEVWMPDPQPEPPTPEDPKMPIFDDATFQAYIDAAATILQPLRPSRPFVELQQGAREMGDRYRGAVTPENPTVSELVWGVYLRDGTPSIDAHVLDTLVAQCVSEQERLQRP